ncbi:MAG TPA: antitoxin [Candidatus Altiarchaeales archaeon]|nr:antitoxin VapB family protein [Thermoplasmata archaeon]RLF49650.1 MAG: antitoxin [Thermoplasmata archaeon]HDN82912.1 antitoxin [Candidatus Altiarchaeales archaeon]
MPFKTLTIKEDVYKKLVAIKREDESFSDLLDKLSGKNVALLRKVRGSIDIKEKDEMIRDIYSRRDERRY